MTNEQRAHKNAAAKSKTAGQQYVVYVFDQGYDVYDADQARIYAPLVIIEGTYVNGSKVA